MVAAMSNCATRSETGGDALSLTPPRLIVALVANFVLGALVTLGIGSYGPSLVLFSLLGMEPRAAFPS
jgi:hypothetical protein